MDANGSHTYKNIGGKSDEYNIIETGDFNGDGVADILWKKGYKNYIWYMNANGSHTYKKITTKKYSSVKGIGDFNGDGVDDILWSYGVWFMNKDGSHVYSSISGSGRVKVADFNGDGVDDIMRGSSYNYFYNMSFEIKNYYYRNRIGNKSYGWKSY